MNISTELRSELLGKFKFVWGGPDLTHTVNNPDLACYREEMLRSMASAQNREISTRAAQMLGGIHFNSLAIRENGLAEEVTKVLLNDFSWVGATDQEGMVKQEPAHKAAQQAHIEARLRQMFGLEQTQRQGLQLAHIA